jgi:hypothetical protein
LVTYPHDGLDTRNDKPAIFEKNIPVLDLRRGHRRIQRFIISGICRTARPEYISIALDRECHLRRNISIIQFFCLSRVCMARESSQLAPNRLPAASCLPYFCKYFRVVKNIRDISGA